MNKQITGFVLFSAVQIPRLLSLSNIFKTFLLLGYFVTYNSVQQTQTPVSTKIHAI